MEGLVIALFCGLSDHFAPLLYNGQIQLLSLNFIKNFSSVGHEYGKSHYDGGGVARKVTLPTASIKMARIHFVPVRILHSRNKVPDEDRTRFIPVTYMTVNDASHVRTFFSADYDINN